MDANLLKRFAQSAKALQADLDALGAGRPQLQVAEATIEEVHFGRTEDGNPTMTLITSSESIGEIEIELTQGQLDHLGEIIRPHLRPGWISVEDRLPKAGNDVLVSDGEAIDIGWWSDEGREWRGSYDPDKRLTVARWMPLPPPPAPGE